MVSVTPRVILMERSEWDNSGQPRLGYAVSRSARTELIVHHTVAIDSNDVSPLVWETDAEIIAHMRVLRTIRPDLGLDVPYNFVAFMRPNRTLTVCEGRGLDRTGAHTHAHNTSGVATSMAGDFHNYPLGDFLSPFILALNDWFHWQKGQLANLQVINGHRDYNGTACPGQHLYATKGSWTWNQAEPPQEVDDMAQVPQAEWNDIRDKTRDIHKWGWWARNMHGLTSRFMRKKSTGEVFVLATRVTNDVPPKLLVSKHHIPDPDTGLMLGFTPDWDNVVDATDAAADAIPTGTAVPHIGWK